ncbi:MAG: hypothetical protein A3C15_00830 [Candidatus Magasanikbacteria bacterium RIFCSPHIGHO2_02_FULL_50_9b]|uniref:GtrA/DPMS transmembrane domain-containing protein n=1 Tax=Candidatus Magasanikbacteria bacterium RIFCSPHIGHO2_02_FULL_50_9b TaxID=1798682 RepID=A0A1F6M8W4_9BACT|nr:MAG: hypothetical protein A3C15_00830 [Candidatus Magasanikbacteria bacterium RIFCSPHIGHO2_02_FULL_50_9b]
MKHHIRAAATWIFNERVRLTRYFITGCSAVIVDAGLYILFTRALSLEEVASNVLSTTCGALYVFLLNKFWSFGSRGGTVRQSRRFLILFMFNYIFSQATFYLLVEKIGFHDLLTKLGIIALMVSWNFLLYKYWVYAVE